MPAPGAPTGATLARTSGDAQITLTWSYSGTLATSFDVQYWNNVAGVWQAVEPVGENDRSKMINSSANRRYIMRVRARNGDGWSSWATSNAIQTTPAGPSNVTMAKNGPRSILIKWSNGASTQNGYDYDTLLEEKVSGGAWTQVAVIDGGKSSAIRSNLSPGDTYAYRVRSRSTVAYTLYSAYSTTGAESIQIFNYPAAPAGLTVTRNSDTRHDLAWTSSPTAVAPISKITVQRLDPATNIWSTVASLGGSITSYVDNALAANSRYQWRVRSENEVGVSAWVTSAAWQTTPAAPVINKVEAVAGGGLKITWINQEPSGYVYTTGLRYYNTAGTLIDDTIVASGGVGEYTITGLSLTESYDIELQARSTTGATLSSGWVSTGLIPASTTPAAPSSLQPGGVAVDFQRDVVLTWSHNPTGDGSAQRQFEVQTSVDNFATSSSSGTVVSTQSTWTLPAGQYANTAAVSWRVRTWGASSTASAYSASASLTGSTTPVVNIITPVPTHQYSSVEATWSYSDTEGSPQAAWELELLDANLLVVEQLSGSDGAASAALTTTVENDLDYTLRIRALDGAGLWSDWTQVQFHVDYIPPQLPLLTIDFAGGAGYAVLTLTPDPADTSGIPADAVTIFRRTSLLEDPDTWGEWEVLAEGLDPTTTITDTEPALGARTQYMATSYAEV